MRSIGPWASGTVTHQRASRYRAPRNGRSRRPEVIAATGGESRCDAVSSLFHQSLTHQTEVELKYIARDLVVDDLYTQPTVATIGIDGIAHDIYRLIEGKCTEFAAGPWLTKPAVAWFWDRYLPDVKACRNPHASALNATPEQSVACRKP